MKTIKDFPNAEQIVNDYHNGAKNLSETITNLGKLVVYPTRPQKPPYPKNENSVAFEKYALELREYERKKENFNSELASFQEDNNVMVSFIEELIKTESGLNNIPEQYRNKVYAHAYSTGHSYGYYEVYLHLVDLVDIFE